MRKGTLSILMENLTYISKQLKNPSRVNTAKALLGKSQSKSESQRKRKNLEKSGEKAKTQLVP